MLCPESGGKDEEKERRDDWQRGVMEMDSDLDGAEEKYHHDFWNCLTKAANGSPWVGAATGEGIGDGVECERDMSVARQTPAYTSGNIT
jgi:hypothetical protein